jgi:hypothetical protein
VLDRGFDVTLAQLFDPEVPAASNIEGDGDFEGAGQNSREDGFILRAEKGRCRSDGESAPALLRLELSGRQRDDREVGTGTSHAFCMGDQDGLSELCRAAILVLAETGHLAQPRPSSYSTIQ